MNEKAETVLSVKDLKKKISGKWIIKSVTFDVGAGEIFGFLGPNGSGKTTTIRMLVDLIKPTGGSVKVCGHDVYRDHNEAMRHVGSIVENPEMYTFLTGWENLEQFASMMPGVMKERIHEVVAMVGLEQRIHDKVKTYSLGMRQRLGIAQALLGRPKLLILDEPTNGLDPQGIKELREFMRKLADDGMSLFISSHLLSEIQLMCDRVAIISHGEVIAVGGVEELLAQAGSRVIWHLDPPDQGRSVLAAAEGVELLEDEALPPEWGESAERMIVTQMNHEDIPQLNALMVQSNIQVFSIQIKNPTLEDLFLSLTEGERID
jgi:ABC-2 type transport system ATP-binding protein